MRIATGKVVKGKLELDGDALEESLREAAQGQVIYAEALLRELRQ